jgi:hypothetical protein
MIIIIIDIDIECDAIGLNSVVISSHKPITSMQNSNSCNIIKFQINYIYIGAKLNQNTVELPVKIKQHLGPV